MKKKKGWHHNNAFYFIYLHQSRVEHYGTEQSPMTEVMDSPPPYRTEKKEEMITSSYAEASTSTSGYYLNADARKQLSAYEYKGADLSLLYQYILSPSAQFLVDTVIPETMAPNTVTLIGLVWMITSYSIYWYYTLGIINNGDGGDGGGDELLESSSLPPRWIFLFNALSLIFYQTLDNMDGKQARRTQSSSPLGLLFDHGCDAINSTLGSANVIIGMNLTSRENTFEIWLLIFGPFIMFYIATWEQYYTGELIMPIINGPSEGVIGTALLSFVSYWFGSQYWQESDWFTSFQSMFPSLDVVTNGVQLKNCDFIVIFVALGIFQEIILKSIAVAQKYKRSLSDLIPVLALSFSYLIIGWADPEVLFSIPRTSMHLAMILFAEMSTELMLAHVTAQPFNPWRWQLYPLICLTIWVVVFGRSELLQYSFTGYMWSMGAYLAMKCAYVIHEICDALEIWCFDIVTPYSKAPKSNIMNRKLA